MKSFLALAVALALQDGQDAAPAYDGTGRIERVAAAAKLPEGALKDRIFSGDDGHPQPLKGKEGDLKIGTRARLKGKVVAGVLQVESVEAWPSLASVGTKDRLGGLTLVFATLEASCDHMPGVGQPKDRQYLFASLRFKNDTPAALKVTLAKARLSFDEKAEGDAAQGFSVRGENGRPSGSKEISLKAGEERTVDFRGDRLFPEGKEGKDLFLLLEFRVGDPRLEQVVVVRMPGKVIKTE